MSIKLPYVITIGCLILLNSCNGQTRTCELNSVNHVNKLQLTQRNDKCGEWGGDTKEILLFRTDFAGELLANVTHFVKLCPPDEDEIENLRIENIKVTNEQECMVLQAIDELLNSKLTTPDIPSHAGYFNGITLSDSSFVIIDFPSINWQTFDELFSSLTE